MSNVNYNNVLLIIDDYLNERELKCIVYVYASTCGENITFNLTVDAFIP